MTGALQSRLAKLEAASPSTLGAVIQIVGDEPVPLDTPDNALVIHFIPVAPGDYEHAPKGGWQISAKGRLKGLDILDAAPRNEHWRDYEKRRAEAQARRLHDLTGDAR